MVYKEFLKRIEKEPDTNGLVYTLEAGAICTWVIPFQLYRLDDKSVSIVKVPPTHVEERTGRVKRVSMIGKNAFRGNENITDVLLSSNITRLSEGCFQGCKNLQRLALPKGIGKIYKDTFAGCDSLTDVYFEGTIDEWKEIKIESEERIFEFGDLIPGTPVQELLSDRLVHLSGNDSLLKATIHFGCILPY
ncbi:MAG: leucine-rich repeat protein [Clostridiales bacterium]|nr:leucine-rich repeat protein [Clostridiales bacterium]